MTGAELKQKRKLMKKTQVEFAAWLGVSQEMVSMMEEGEKLVPQEVADKVTAGGMFQ